ncbi:MAG TPA: hypothetical protein VMW20_08725 [Candidatus Nanoarchaeia archaeon]|nr:hypothetical protein [Candidatus Nanoarchaeia archaeon]
MDEFEYFKCLDCLRYDPAEDMCEIHFWIDPYENPCGLFILDSA